MATTTRTSDGRRTKRSQPDSQPHLEKLGHEVQRFDQLRELPLGLPAATRREMCERLNTVLADSRILHDLYKKSHWLMRGPTFYQLHLLTDRHAEEQEELIDKIAERIQTLGGIAAGDPRHVAELTGIPRPPDGAEGVPAMLSRLLQAHEHIVVEAREVATKADELGDVGTNDLLASEVVPVNELQIWFVAEHLVDIPLVRD